MHDDDHPREEQNPNELITKAIAIEIEDAKESTNLGFMARALIQATMSHRAVEVHKSAKYLCHE